MPRHTSTIRQAIDQRLDVTVRPDGPDQLVGTSSREVTDRFKHNPHPVQLRGASPAAERRFTGSKQV